MGLGALLGVLATIGMVADLGADTTTATSPPSEEAAATTTILDETPSSVASTEAPTTIEQSTSAPTTGSTAPPTTTPAETPEEFLADLAAAFRASDVEFKLARLHPAVIERFGEELCRTYLSTIAPDASAAFVVTSVSEPADYDWTIAGQTTTVPETVSVEVTRTANGVASAATVHLTPVDGQLRWYTDCSA
jgi:hypothetical protein